MASLHAWLAPAGIAEELEELEEPDGERRPVFVFRPVHRNGTTVATRGMSVAVVNNAVQRATGRSPPDPLDSPTLLCLDEGDNFNGGSRTQTPIAEVAVNGRCGTERKA